jgi:tetratricopeptide (TPR) repeat protein
MSETNDTASPATQEPDEGESSRGPLGRWIGVSLAAIAVVGAGIGILQTDASVNESNTARETTRTAVGALRASVIEGAGQLLEEDIDAESGALLREQAFVARQAGDLAEPLTFDELRSIIPEGGDLPSARTREALRELSFDSERLALRQAALAETRVTWNDRSTQYTTAIAVLAVALFLVGFSLVLGGRRRVVFYALGVGVALVTIGVTTYIVLLPIPETPDEAVAATARGSVATDQDKQDRAVGLFDEAIEIDDDYAEPYSRRAIARVLADNPDLRETGALTGDTATLEEAAADARRGFELSGDRDLLALAFGAIIGVYAGEYETSVRAATEAIAINGQIPDFFFAKSAAEVGLGDEDAAADSLDGALDLLSGSDPSERTRGLVAEYLTYLEQVVDRTPERAELVSRIEERIIGIETAFNLDREVAGQTPDRGSVEVEGLRYDDGRFRLRTQWDDLPPGTALTLIGFERPAPDRGWVQPRELALFRTVGGSGEDAGGVPIERACTPVELRVDVYLDGAYSESFTGPGGEATC